MPTNNQESPEKLDAIDKLTIGTARAGGLVGVATLGTLGNVFQGYQLGTELFRQEMAKRRSGGQLELDLRQTANETTALIARSGRFLDLVTELERAGLIPPRTEVTTSELFDHVSDAIVGITNAKIAELSGRNTVAQKAIPALISEAKERRQKALALASDLSAPIEGAARELVRTPIGVLEQALVSTAIMVRESGLEIIATAGTLIGTFGGWAGALPAIVTGTAAEATPDIAKPIPIGLFLGMLGGIIIASSNQINIEQPEFWVYFREGALVGLISGAILTFIFAIGKAKFG